MDIRLHDQEKDAGIPNARLAILPGSHFIAEKKPERFNQEVQHFLNTIEQ